MNNKTKEIVINAILLALLIISSKISFMISEIAFTPQVLVVLIIILIRGYKNCFIIIGSYLFLGLGMQLPVFSTGGGFAYIYSPSFGFILGFIVAIIPMRLFQTKVAIKNIFVMNLISSLIGIIVIYIFGISYGYLIFELYRDTHYNLSELMAIFITPFLVFDSIKVLLASIIASRLKKII